MKISTLYGHGAWHFPHAEHTCCLFVATLISFLPPTTIPFTTTTATPTMPPKTQSKTPTKAAANSHKRQVSKADQQPVKQTHHSTKENNNNNNNHPEDATAADFEDQATKAKGKGGKRAARGRGKKGPTPRCVVHMVDGNHAIDRVLTPPHLQPTDPPSQENCAGSQSQGCGSQNPPQV